jgi:hypothetical protein
MVECRCHDVAPYESAKVRPAGRAKVLAFLSRASGMCVLET